ncbi:DUF4258 domain-containing protein [Algibacter mikhailovii]|uniref:DUF4258 domain-containing protein n=1 Tax=Algibacter mikhailovii TaxID=425498 RepID=A0A918QWI9_9FLAO|nr:DUF4258 domain-containing protein [Algibacter mikhailovii]GGZ70220.1 hypothetical protein GCM10007028_04160 [Algibacter mikhailovii]
MKLIQRIGYYLGGFSLGLIILAFFLNGKKTSCSYGPESRVLKNITSKKIITTNHANKVIKSISIDSNLIRSIMKKGDIDFSKSDPRNKPCGIYLIEGQLKEQNLLITIENCDSIATITDFKILK